MASRRSSAAAEPADLRQRILDTSRALLDELGVAGLSLREVARRAGVTHQAPYHHFADRESILAELVTQGFEDLARRLARANMTVGDLRATLVASGSAYVLFALDHPGVFRVMFRGDLCDPKRFVQVQAAGERAHGELRQLVRLVHGGGDEEALATWHWAQVHGLASLLLDGPLGQHVLSRRERLAFVHQAMTLHARLALGTPPPPPKKKASRA
jgi:AcrR family transcriptional regulator